jgi:hypothetical protein
MPRYNTQFELNTDDMETIETALQTRKKDLSLKRIALLSADGDAQVEADALKQIDADLVEIHDLLGRLHNQKVFYRPETVKDAPYIGG